MRRPQEEAKTAGCSIPPLATIVLGLCLLGLGVHGRGLCFSSRLKRNNYIKLSSKMTFCVEDVITSLMLFLFLRKIITSRVFCMCVKVPT